MPTPARPTPSPPAPPTVERRWQAIRARLRRSDPLWLARWGVLVLLLFDLLFDVPAPGVVDAAWSLPRTGFGLAVIGGAAVANLALRVAQRRGAVLEQRRLAGYSVALDVSLVAWFVWANLGVAFAGHSLLAFLAVVGAAWQLGLRAAMLTWSACMVIVGSAAIAATRLNVTALTVPQAVLFPAVLALVAVASGLLADQLTARQQALAEATAARDQELAWRRALLAMLAHDLRSPIATAGSSAELLVMRGDELGPDARVRLLQSVARQTRRARLLLDDLLDLGRAGAGALTLDTQPVVPGQLVRTLLEDLPTDVADEVSVTDHSGGKIVETDPGRCTQILWNLLSNAVKHGQPPIEVRIRPVDGPGPHVIEVCVLDHGVGPPKEVVGRLFSPYVSSGSSGSTGLGLWISQVLADALGGSLTSAREDGLTAFTLRLPQRPPTAGAPGEGSDEQPSGAAQPSSAALRPRT